MAQAQVLGCEGTAPSPSRNLSGSVSRGWAPPCLACSAIPLQDLCRSPALVWCCTVIGQNEKQVSLLDCMMVLIHL